MKAKQVVQLAAAIAFLLMGCSHGSSSPHDRLNGTWTSNIMTVTIDFPAHKYSGVAMGEQFSHYLDLVSENANVVVFKESDATIVCQIQDDGSIMITKQGSEGGIPLILHRAKDSPTS
ncbi:MAG: hypothetical protein WCE23_16510 [Candidatus Binatus sp.]|uniref:hypothetical protein n=1 Tax=Candidatus Binatus sp. TaxID=2811406 RepID=UPI003C747638